MTILENIQRLQAEGRDEQEIISELQQKGFSPREISENIAQARIKEAVLADESSAPAPGQESYQQSYSQDNSQYTSQPSQSQSSYQDYQPQYDSYSPGISTDTITEVAEQIVLEKLSPLKERIEQIISLKSSMEAGIDSLDERLKRIEKIIDRLQLSILQKVGEYVANVSDLKKEMEETQKSFKSLLPHHKR